MSKAYKVWEITKQKMKEISSNGENWMDFLSSASYTLKYNFAEQVALYAYRPEARACATMETWNKVFNHWVNKGAKGIPIPDFSTETPRLKYVFDIADTHPTIYTRKSPEIWEYNEDYEQAYKDIEEMYNINPTLPLEERVVELVDNLVEERFYDYSLEISEAIKDSYIDGIEQNEVNQMSRRLLRNSTSYMMMERMDLQPNLYFDWNEFRDITLFSSGLLSVLGTYSSGIVSNLIDDIRDRKILLDNINLRQNIVHNVLPLDDKVVYNDIKDIEMSTKEILRGGHSSNERDSDKQQDIYSGEGDLHSQDSRDELRTDGRNLFDEGRSTDSQRRNDGKEDGQIRQDERGISKGEQEGLLQQFDLGRDIGRTFIGSTGIGRENEGSNDSSIPREEEGNRGIESTRTAEMDTGDEQYQQLSGGNNKERSDIRISDDFPTENEQLKIIEEVVERESATFSISQKNIDDELARGSGFQDGKHRIYTHFQENNTKKETMDFLKKEYGIGGHSTPNRGDFIDSAFHDAKGLHLSKRSDSSDDIINIDLSWSQVATRIKELIDADRYFNSKEKENYQRYLSEESLDEVQPLESQVEGKIYDYKIDNIVYIGNEELRILEFNKDEVTLQNINFPLFIEKMQIGEFERKIRENPLNNDSFIEGESTLDIEISEGIQERDPDENPHNLVTERMAKNVPDILGNSDIDNKDKVVQAIYFVPFRDWTWYLTELNQNSNLAFGLVAGHEVEWGYFSIDELKEIKAERLLNFTPKTFEELKDTELKRNLTDFELEIAFNGELQYEEADLEETNISSFPELNTDGIAFINKDEVALLNEGNLSEDKISDIGLYLTYDNGKWIGFDYSSKEVFVEEFDTIDECINWLNQVELEIESDRSYNLIYSEDEDKGINVSTEESKNIAYIHSNGRLSIYDDEMPTYAIDELIEKALPIQRNSTVEELEEGIIFNIFSDTFYIIDREKINGKEYFLLESHFTGDERPHIVVTNDFQIVDTDIIRGLDEFREFYTDTESLAVGVGRVFQIVSGKDVRDIDLTDTGITLEVNGVRYSLLKGTTFQESEKIDVLLDIKGELRLSDYLDESEPLKEVDLIENQPRNNYVIKDKTLGVGSPKEKFQRNVEAISKLKEIESENRMATPEEQEILSKYVGWGGLSSAFEANSSEFNTLKTLLTEDEFEKARESTLSAFYTPPIVIESMYKALENMGFREGNLLEPSCGIGNFMGLIPETMKDSKIYGIELDDISGRIAKQLYQENNIAIQGFEETNLPDSFFDVAIGNVPFGQFGVLDKKYEKNNFLIHDYFFAKSLDKVRPGGIIAFITSKGTMDKENESVRRYIAERADLIGAIRLPNDTFKANAGTEVTSDILFFQKRDSIIDIEPDWIYIGENEDGIRMNSYFIDNPHMVLGKMEMQSGPFGLESTCTPINTPLENLLDAVVNELDGEIVASSLYEVEEEQNTIPADLNTKNYSFTDIDGEIYYRENSIMIKKEYNELDTKRILGMIEIRELTRSIIEAQLEDYSDDEIKLRQKKLNTSYGKFVEEFGRISDKKNVKLFEEDSSIMLISSLEVLDSERNFKEKAAIFTKRTIGKSVPLTEVETAEEALVVSINEKAKVNLDYMAELARIPKEEIADELYGVIFKDPESDMYYSSDEYLSGNIREKLKIATNNLNSKLNDAQSLEKQGVFSKRLDSLNKEIRQLKVNIDALESVKPKDLDASEISVRLGTTWIPAEDIEKFMFETFETPGYHKWNINVRFSSYTSNWNIEGKSVDSDNIKAITTYGTSRLNAYKILEDTLNLKEVRVFDRTTDQEGKEISVINKKETMLAQQKQDLIKEAFQDWIWKEPERRNRLTKTYNELFNSIRPREYEGSHLNFPGMNPEVSLREHQKNAIAHTLYGGNTLLAHCVGAGKTYEMVASAMESKRLGLCNKSLLVVPNHLTEQIGTEFIELYPSADILVATKKDFEPKNRKRFCSRIATGDFDAVVIGHSQFEKIPMSIERQRYEIERQIEEITDGIAEIKANQGDRFSIKQLEKTKKNLRVKLGKLNDTSRKDDVVTFEELGIDRLYVDEAHNYKNLYLHTKMRNVAGIGTSEAQKSSDMFMKCRYLDEITEGKGIIFATGTPISNSMTELYTMQRYLQFNTLKKMGLTHFDSWASTFGETVTAIELSPEGTGYRPKTRFAKFYNLPELMNIFKEVADIKTSDVLNLPVPEAQYETISVKPSEFQKEMVESLGERADRVRAKLVDSRVDNMLKITNDGRKLALDQRLLNPMLPDDDNNKSSLCAQKTFDIWKDTIDERLTQLIFCDLSTPKAGEFNVYDDVKNKLIDKGIPDEEIAFIHDAKTELQKDALFAKVREGEVRILLGSTQKMGTGTNCQDRLIALHDLDCPWRPADLEQRSGRIIRQGNQNERVHIFRYVTENTFDAYLWQLVENKQKFIGQIMTSKSPVRSAEDVDESALSYAEIKALATGNPLIKEKMDLDVQVAKLKMLKANYLSEKYKLEDKIAKNYPREIKSLEEKIQGYEKDISTVKDNTSLGFDGKKIFTPMEIKGVMYPDKEKAGKALLKLCKEKKSSEKELIGNYRGMKMELSYDRFSNVYQISLGNRMKHWVNLGEDLYGNITRIDNALEGIDKKMNDSQEKLENVRSQLELAKVEVEKPFVSGQDLKVKQQRLTELESILNMTDKIEIEKENPLLDKAKSLISDFISNEYESSVDDSVFEDLSNISLAYTTTEDNMHQIQAVIDLENPGFKQYIDGKLIYEETYQSLNDLITYQLEFLEFDSLVSIEPEDLKKFKVELDYDRDNDGAIDRYDADFKDPGVQSYGSLDEREDYRGDNDYIGDNKPKRSLLERLESKAIKMKKDINIESEKLNAWER